MQTLTKTNEFTAAEIEAASRNPYKIGGGVTLCGYSDRKAFTVIAVTATTIKIQRDKAVLLNGANSGEPDALTFSRGGFVGHTSGTQRYQVEPDPNGMILIARMRRTPRRVQLHWSEQTATRTEKLVPEFKAASARVIAGRHEHYDFNF